MSKKIIAIDPVTRLEGHLKVEVSVEDGVVTDARITGGMYRGFESILRGRNPRDAVQIVQRICGVCRSPMPQPPLWRWRMHAGRRFRPTGALHAT